MPSKVDICAHVLSACWPPHALHVTCESANTGLAMIRGRWTISELSEATVMQAPACESVHVWASRAVIRNVKVAMLQSSPSFCLKCWKEKNETMKSSLRLGFGAGGRCWVHVLIVHS